MGNQVGRICSAMKSELVHISGVSEAEFPRVLSISASDNTLFEQVHFLSLQSSIAYMNPFICAKKASTKKTAHVKNTCFLHLTQCDFKDSIHFLAKLICNSCRNLCHASSMTPLLSACLHFISVHGIHRMCNSARKHYSSFSPPPCMNR